MATRKREEIWYRCRKCKHHGVIADGLRGRPRCSKCKSYDYGLTLNDPTKPHRLQMTNSGPLSANVLLPEMPVDVEAALRAGHYP